jgi:hypothetical protein
MSASFTLRLPLFEIFKDFMKDQNNKIKLIYLRYIFETFFSDNKFDIDSDGYLTITLDYANILDAACDMLYSTSDKDLPELQKDDCTGFVDYNIFIADDDLENENFEDHNYTRSAMFNEIVKYFNEYFKYETGPYAYDHFIITLKYDTLKKYCIDEDFDANFKNTIMNYKESNNNRKMSIKAYKRYMELVHD